MSESSLSQSQPLRAAYCRYVLKFKEPATTSRETMTQKETYLVKVWYDGAPDVYGLGECAIFRGLSDDDTPDYEQQLAAICLQTNQTGVCPGIWQSSIRFGFETALADLNNGGTRRPYPTPWSQGSGQIEINGLVWMGTIEEMQRRVDQKIRQGFRCVKFKIGGQDFDREVELLQQVRQAFDTTLLEIRLDANGAFSPKEALHKLERLAPIGIHSIEQPIRPKQWLEMAEICRNSPIPVALDEELIGTPEPTIRRRILETIKPQYIILKPSLCGGISGAQAWIGQADALGIGWWVTSALESNIGLNALAQWVSTLNVSMPQGLGTGNLYVNNIESPLLQVHSGLIYDPDGKWVIPDITWI